MKLRSWTRFTEEPPLKMIVDSAPPMEASVADESFGGIGLWLSDVTALAVDKEVTIHYFGQPMQAIVQYISPPRDGVHRVGLEWKSPEK